MQPIASSSIAPITVVNTRVIFCQAENFSEPDFNFRANSSSIYPHHEETSHTFHLLQPGS